MPMQYGGKYGPIWDAQGQGGEREGNSVNYWPSQPGGFSGGPGMGSMADGGYTGGYSKGPPNQFGSPSGGGLGWLGSLGGWIVENGGKALQAAGGGSAGKGVANIALTALLVQQMKEASDARKKDQEFRQGLFNTAQTHLGKAEGVYDEKAPLRQAGSDAMLSALSNMPTGAMDFLKSNRTAGQYVK